MNQFSSLYRTNDYDETMTHATDIVAYCAETDPQADRVLDIITRFSKVVTKWTKDHTYDAPELSDDFRCLYSQASTSRLPSEHTNPVSTTASFRGQASSQHISVSDPGLLTPPSIAKLPLLDTLSTHLLSAVPGTRVHGLSSPHTNYPFGSLVGTRPSVSAHSSIEGSEQLSGNVEFEFDGLWNSFINYLPPVSTVAPGISSLAQFPPPVIGTPTEPFGRCPIPQELKIFPP